MKNLYESIKQVISEKTLTPFQQEFAKQMKEKGAGKTFTWQDPKTGKSTEILLKYKEEPKPQAAVKPEAKKEPPKVEPAKPEVKKPEPEAGVDKKKSDELFADIRKDAQGKSPEEVRAAAQKALKDTEADLAKKEGPKPAEPIKTEPQSAEMEIKTVDMIKDKEKNSKKTNEEIKMSINKKFNVSDALYSSVMEVMAKSSGGTVPKNEKQKQLAAKHGDPNVITHGDVLKARGVKMKEEAEQVDELSRGKLVSYIEKASKTKGAEAMARISGIKKAAAKLKDIKKQSMQSEDVEQVDEISKGTLGSYISKSADKAREHGFYGGVAFTKGKLGQSDYHAKKELKRTTGINKALGRLTKEEALDEAKKLISKHGEDQPISAKVYKDTEWNEYQVHFFKDGKHMGEGPVSYHDDKEDAQNTADHALEKMNKSKTNAASIVAAAKKRSAGEHAMEEKIIEGTMRGGKYVDDAPRPGTNEVPVPDEGYRPPKSQPKKPVKSSDTSKLNDVEEAVRGVHGDGKYAGEDPSTPDERDDIAQKIKAKRAANRADPTMSDTVPGMRKRPQYGRESGGNYATRRNEKLGEESKNMDTPGNSYEHQCAIHVRSESFGEGRTITTQHADPDEYGNIAWYDVMFEHGIEKFVPTNSLEILVSESHMHSKRKKKGM